MSQQQDPPLVVGDKVRFKIGRGYAVGTISNIVDDNAEILTEKERLIIRPLDNLSRNHETC